MSLKRFTARPLDQIVKDSLKPQIQALPVWYKGYQFRSRLEGRWAVFFDAMGIAFQYEAQGFKLTDGTCYLPDFLLSGANAFGEVKPTEPTPAERLKCELTVNGLGGTFIYLVGTPDFISYSAVCLDAGMLAEITVSLDIFAHPKAYFREGRFWSDPDLDELSEEGCTPEYRAAVYLARGCRFDGSEPEKSNITDRERVSHNA
jgi:hypothetical protein